METAIKEFLKEQLSIISINVCSNIKNLTRIKVRNPLVNVTDVVFSFTHVVNFKSKKQKQAFADNLIAILDSIDFTDDELKKCFLTDYFKEVVRNNFDKVFIHSGGVNSIVGESIFTTLYESVNLIYTKEKEICDYFNYILSQYVNKVSEYFITLVQIPTKIVNVDTKFHNKYQKAVSTLNNIFTSITKNDIKYNQCFDILYHYVNCNLKNVDNRKYSWFVSGILVVENLRLLRSRLYGETEYDYLQIRSNIIKAIAFTSGINDDVIARRKSSINFKINSVEHLQNRTFDKCLEAIKKFYQEIEKTTPGRILLPNDIVVKIYPILDKIISDRVAKNQLFNN